MRITRAARVASPWIVAATLSLCGAPARAGELGVDAQACAGLDATRLHALLSLEVAPVLEANPKMSGLQVVVTCSPRAVTVLVRDPVTGKQLQRDMPAPDPDDPERERIVALAASQLFRASWLELTAAAPERAESIASPTPEGREQRAALKVVEVHEERRSGPHEISMRTTLRWRDLGAPVLMNHGGLRYGHRIPHRFFVFGDVSAGYGRATRGLGAVDVVDVIAGVGAGWRTRRFGPFTLDLELGGALVYERLRGRGATSVVEEGTIWALTGEAVGAVGLSAHARAVIATVAAEGGFLFAGPRGGVTGEADVDPDGAWLGIGLRIGAVLPGRR